MQKAVTILVRVFADGVAASFSVDLEREPYWLDTSAVQEPGTPTAVGQVELQNFPRGAGAGMPVAATSTMSLGGIAPIGAAVSGSIVTVTYASAPSAGANAVIPIVLLF